MKWKERFRNKAFWVSLVSLFVLLSQQLGINIFPDNVAEIANTILSIFVLLGIIIDPTTSGVADGK